MEQERSEAALRALGAVLVATSAAVFGLAGAMTKSIHADALVITCWRGLLGGLLITVYVLWRRSRGGPGLALGWRGWLVAVVGGIASIAFISAFKYGYVANTVLIYATVPFVSALFGWLVLSERFRGRTMVSAAVSVIGVSVIVFAGLNAGGRLGDLMAVIMTVLSAVYLVMLRKFRDTPTVWAGAVSGFLLFGFGWIVSDPMSVTGADMAYLCAFGVAFAVAAILWTEGARLVPAAEAGLLGTAEVPFAILFAWMIVGEIPPKPSLVGGAVVLAAVLAHAYLDLKDARSASASNQQTPQTI